jgi:DNA polymerase-3 subunit gamma/tau
MMEALQIKDIDTMIRGLEQELKGVEIKEIMVTTPTPDLSVPKEVITITEEEILSPASSEKESVERLALSAEKKTPSETVSVQKEEKSPEPEVTTTTNISIPIQEPSSTETPIEHVAKISSEPIETMPTSTAETKEMPVPQEQVQKNKEPSLNTERLTLNANLFDTLVKKIYDRDYDLGSCFERNITFVSFKENLLTWESTAEEDDKKMLIKHWGVINMFVKELFGFETKIKNIAKKKALTDSSEQVASSNKSFSQTDNTELTENTPAPHNDADSGSMIEEVEMKSSCIAPDAGNTEAAKEKDPSTLLEEPMIKAAMELFSPKKVRIKKNV